VLLVSGYADSLISGIQGRYRLLDKPFRQEQLARTVREMLDQRGPAPADAAAPAPAQHEEVRTPRPRPPHLASVK
jgi:hypothetical protein